MLQVGGEFFQVMLSNMNLFGRISICGAISVYNATEKPKCESSVECVPVAMNTAPNERLGAGTDIISMIYKCRVSLCSNY